MPIKYIKIALILGVISTFILSVNAKSVLNASSIIKSKTKSNSHRQPRQVSSWFETFFRPSPGATSISCSCTCGNSNTNSKTDLKVLKNNFTDDDSETRIVGGKTTISNEYPWMVRLLYMDQGYCGGALINDRYVLTAAHCTKTMWFLMKVTFGEHDRCSGKAPLVRFVSRIISRRSFFSVFIDDDIALLRLDNRVPIGRIIRPICLPTNKDATYEGSRGIVAGWGATMEKGRTSCVLRHVSVPIISNQDCYHNTNYRNISSIVMSENMMCAGYSKGGADSCQGDSGGPIFLQRDDKHHEIIGIVSWGVGCARPDYPGVYTRVTKYLDWILSNTRDACYCQG